jgi:7,8-dihydropterin-6-yl-methyl-4-(beta-D-ribofuranosyl)aminobenzene 5'-phosphate synthase
MRITSLKDNNAGINAGCLAEWGHSNLLEHNGPVFCWIPAGTAGVALANAGHLGVRLENLDCLVLSRGYYDHTGGLAALLGERPFSFSLIQGTFSVNFWKNGLMFGGC